MSQPGVRGAPVASPVALESRWALSSLKPFASWFKLLMFFAGSNGQVRTRTVRQSARGGGTPCPALIDYRWCGSARNCKAGYFKWWSLDGEPLRPQMPHYRVPLNCERPPKNWVHMTLLMTLNGKWNMIMSGPLAVALVHDEKFDLLMILPDQNLRITSMSKWYKVGQQVMVYACALCKTKKCKSKKRGWKQLHIQKLTWPRLPLPSMP